MNQESFNKCLWISLDRDKDGEVSLNEFRKFYERKNKFYEKFKQETNSFSLDHADAQGFQFYKKKSDQEILDEFNKIDSNKDGKISYEGI